MISVAYSRICGDELNKKSTDLGLCCKFLNFGFKCMNLAGFEKEIVILKLLRNHESVETLNSDNQVNV